MKITLNGVTLADSAAGLPPMEMRLNGVRVVELVDFARAAAKGVFSRGNASTTLSFSVGRFYPILADAEDAFLLAESQAPIQGPLLIRQSGAAPARPPVGAASAVLQSVVPNSDNGQRIVTAYTIQAGRLVGGAALPFVFDTESSPPMISAAPIPAGQSSVAVNFPAPLNGPQVVVGTIVAPVPGLDVPAVLAIESVTAAGFVARLSAPVPSAGFLLPYTAKATA